MCPEHLAEVNEGWVGTEVSNGVGELGPGGYPEPHSPPAPAPAVPAMEEGQGKESEGKWQRGESKHNVKMMSGNGVTMQKKPQTCPVAHYCFRTSPSPQIVAESTRLQLHFAPF